MRKLPSTKKEREEKFIDGALSNTVEETLVKDDLHQYVKRTKWPILEEKVSPSYAEGSKLNKGINLPLKEYEWNTVDRHTKTLGIPKTEWIRHAIFRLLEEEQLYFMKHKDT